MMQNLSELSDEDQNLIDELILRPILKLDDRNLLFKLRADCIKIGRGDEPQEKLFVQISITFDEILKRMAKNKEVKGEG